MSPVSATEGSSTGTVTVATFTDANPSATAGDFTATINWGDGTSSSGTITEDPNTKIFSVNGAAHTYTEEGQYTITVDDRRRRRQHDDRDQHGDGG